MDVARAATSFGVRYGAWRYWANSHLYGPTLREIAAAMGIASVNGVQGHLKALQKKGVLKHTPGIARGIELTEAYR